MSREEAIEVYNTPPEAGQELIEYFRKRLGLSVEEYERVMNGPRARYEDFETYKSLFERLRPLFHILAKANLVPMSFYIKYWSKREFLGLHDHAGRLRGG